MWLVPPFGPLGLTILAQSELGIDNAAETAATFAGNALLKARHAARLSGLPAIADDSGLCVDALGGRPGVQSARYAGTNASDSENVSKLLAELRGVPADQRPRYVHDGIRSVLRSVGRHGRLDTAARRAVDKKGQSATRGSECSLVARLAF